MVDLWMPGAVRSPQPGGVTLDRSLPARATWHITADQLDANGTPPPFKNVATYLKNVQYCPTLMWDPVTGYMEQYYPADKGGRALTQWNEDGAYHVQVETYFSYGVNRDGKRYATVADTPCKGWAELLGWLDSLGIPRVWPMGSPTFGRREDVNIWNTRAGHYGHSQVPGENHVDPGPMPAFPAGPTITPAGSAPAARELLIPGIPDLYK